MSIFDGFRPQVNHDEGERIKILSLRRNPAESKIKAFLDIEIAGFGVVSDCKIVQRPGQMAWLAMPDKPWQGSDGKTKYKALIKLTEPLKAMVEDVVRAAWRDAQ